MKKLFLGLLLALSPTFLWADRDLIVPINDFSPGVDTQHLPDKIKGLQNARNFRTDKNFGLTRRDGLYNETQGCAFSTAAALHLWSFTDTAGSNWIIMLDSNGWITAANGLGLSATCLTTAVTGQISLATDTDADVGLGLFWFTNKTNGLWSWDHTTVTSYPNAPLASRVAIYKNRVVLADISNEQSSIRLSGELNGGDWNNDSRFSTSPISIRIGGVNDGYKVYDFFPGMGEGIIFKANSMYRLLGNDQRDFQAPQITPEIGTIYPNTITQRGFATIFLSNRGLDAYTPPYNFSPIGNPIQNLLDPLARASSLAKSLTVDSATDWTLGTSSPSQAISTYTIVGSVAANNHTFNDTVETDWSLGLSSNTASLLSTTTVAGTLTFVSTAIGVLQNASFETAGAVSTNALNWTITADTGSDDVISAGNPRELRRTDLNATESLPPFDGTYTMTQLTEWIGGIGLNPSSTSTFVQLLDASGNILMTQRTPLTGVGWNKVEVDTSLFKSRLGKVQIGSLWIAPLSPTTRISSTMTTTYNLYFGTSVVYYARADSKPYGGGNQKSLVSLDLSSIGIGWDASNLRANFVSQTFDARVSSPSYDPFRASIHQLSNSSGTSTWGVQTSSADNNCCWSASINVSTTSPNITNAQQRYIRYVATFTASITSTESVIIQVDSVTLGAYTTGYYRSAALDLGTGVSSWGLFTAADNTGGDGVISYETQSNSVPSFVESAWVPTTLNTVPVIPTNRYVFARITMQTRASTATPFVDNMTFNWNIGAGNPKPFASTFREGYYLFFSTNLANITTNDQIAVYNRDNVFNTFYGSTLAASTVYNNTLMMADALGTGAIYSLDKAVDGKDNGRNVESFFTVRRLDGDTPDAEKIFDKIYMTVSRENSSVSQIFKVEYAVDGSTTFYRAENVEISTGSKLTTEASNFNSELPTQGHHIDIKISELTQGTMPYTINRLALYGTIKEIP